MFTQVFMNPGLSVHTGYFGTGDISEANPEKSVPTLLRSKFSAKVGASPVQRLALAQC